MHHQGHLVEVVLGKLLFPHVEFGFDLGGQGVQPRPEVRPGVERSTNCERVLRGVDRVRAARGHDSGGASVVRLEAMRDRLTGDHHG